MTTGIYCLVAADGREYVGSSVRVEGRIRSHLCDVKNGSHSNALVQRASLGGPFKALVLEECSPEKLAEREQHHINKRKPALNLARYVTRDGFAPAPKLPVIRDIPIPVDDQIGKFMAIVCDRDQEWELLAWLFGRKIDFNTSGDFFVRMTLENAALLRDCPYAIWSKKYSGKPLFFDHSDLNPERDNVHRIKVDKRCRDDRRKIRGRLITVETIRSLIDKGILIDHSLA